MISKVWYGGIYLKYEGGYEIMTRALEHYLKRLRNISQSPELADSPTFVQLIQHEAKKHIPLIEELCFKLKESLHDDLALLFLSNHKDYLFKSLDSYEADLQRAINSDKYYSKLIDSSFQNNHELFLIRKIKKIL